jgi:methyl-accepting chemotaxis protein
VGLRSIQSSIASAVEEQTATTNEIGRGAGQAARGSSEITHSIGAVARHAETTSSSIARSLQAASSLAGLASELEALVRRFRLDTAGPSGGSKTS